MMQSVGKLTIFYYFFIHSFILHAMEKKSKSFVYNFSKDIVSYIALCGTQNINQKQYNMRYDMGTEQLLIPYTIRSISVVKQTSSGQAYEGSLEPQPRDKCFLNVQLWERMTIKNTFLRLDQDTVNTDDRFALPLVDSLNCPSLFFDGINAQRRAIFVRSPHQKYELYLLQQSKNHCGKVDHKEVLKPLCTGQ